MKTKFLASIASLLLLFAVAHRSDAAQELTNLYQQLGVLVPRTWLRTGFAEDQGKRDEMEDAHVIEFVPAHAGFPAYAFFAVYDGHGGREVADFAAAHLHHYFDTFLEKTKKIKTAFHMSFDNVQEDLMRFDTVQKDLVPKFKNDPGSTAAVAVVYNQTIYTAWAGDSRIVLYNASGKTIDLSNDHKPDPDKRPDEVKRIKDAGGKVTRRTPESPWRVYHGLSLSRALGDISSHPYVISEPDLMDHPLVKGDQFLIIACDGVWDVFTSQEAGTFVAQSLKNHKDDADPFKSAAKDLVKAALDKKSGDNITVIVADLSTIAS